MCTRVLTCAGVWAPFFCHTSNEISTFSILTIAIVYESINISKEISTFPVFRIEALQKYQYSNEISRVLRYGDVIKHFAGELGGKGGGRADMAQGGGSDVAALPAVLASLPDWVAVQLS